MKRRRGGFAFGVLLLAVGACADTSARQNRPEQNSTTDLDATDVVARVEDRNITLEEVDRRALSLDAGRFNGLRLQQALYEARRETIDRLIAEHLIDTAAKVRSLTRDAVIEQEVTRKVAPVQDAEVETWYQQNAARVRGAPLEQVKQPIRQLLQEERRQTAMNTLVNGLRSKATVRVSLPPPRQAVNVNAQDPAKGPANAPVQIVEFSDFECPFCGRVTPTVSKILAAYGDHVRIVFRDFPLSIHAHAIKAAEAAQCAHAQNKFWEYHDKLFANQQALLPPQLKQYAVDLGLDATKFNTCVDEAGTAQAVRQDVSDGEAIGVTSTPAFFINGRAIAGAKPFEEFKQIIDEELDLKGATPKR